MYQAFRPMNVDCQLYHHWLIECYCIPQNRDFVEAFGPLDMFHMGGDEVNLNCWNSSQEVRDYLEAQGQVST